MSYLIVFSLIILSGLFSGLTLGFFSLNKHDLKRKAELGNKNAKKIYRLRKQGNLLLCTLLIGNVAVNSALAIFLGSIAPGVVAGFLATALIVIFGEIAPQATFARYALKLGAKLTWFAQTAMFIFYPVCWPLAWILDKILGSEIPSIYSKQELIKIVEEHQDSKRSEIDADEEKIVKGALSYSHKKVKEVMTPRSDIYALPDHKQLTKELIEEIKNTGLSRIPIYQKNLDYITGLLYAKNLIDPNVDNKIIKDVARKKIHFIHENKKLDEVLNLFRKTRNHLFIVKNQVGKVVGIIAIEDVIEEILGREIDDEFDN